MKLHRITAIAVAPLSLIASLAAHLPSAPVIAAGAGLAALSLHGSASAESGKRVCGIVYTKGGQTVGYVVKVPKFAAGISCAGYKAGMDSSGIKPAVNNARSKLGYSGWHKADFGPASCEDFSKSKMHISNDICFQMKQGRVYTFGGSWLTN